MPLLEISGVSVAFGGVRALNDVTVSVEGGQVLGLIGPNGAGKTTLLNVVSRFVPPQRGDLRLGNRSLLRYRPDQLVRLGVARSFQIPQLFSGLTVLDHLRLAAERSTRQRGSAERVAREVLEEFGLGEVATSFPHLLPSAVQKRVDLARAVAARPQLLLLDEPAAGLGAEERVGFARWLREFRRRQGCAVVLVEHDVELVAGCSDRVVVLDFGRIIASGSPEEVRRDPAVLQAYLGVANGVGA
ncbi:MAG: ABC transporter ATP-binding protein [bacterium]